MFMAAFPTGEDDRALVGGAAGTAWLIGAEFSLCGDNDLDIDLPVSDGADISGPTVEIWGATLSSLRGDVGRPATTIVGLAGLARVGETLPKLKPVGELKTVAADADNEGARAAISPGAVAPATAPKEPPRARTCGSTISWTSGKDGTVALSRPGGETFLCVGDTARTTGTILTGESGRTVAPCATCTTVGTLGLASTDPLIDIPIPPRAEFERTLF
mmetsp:Transcript_146809/g.258744  ORF Transcript_146809/g.258744 Transcript_146809/m.258744 type:complete len:217 (-) Transcript_146809:1560-2210(-)